MYEEKGRGILANRGEKAAIASDGKIDILNNRFTGNGDAIDYGDGGGICRNNLFEYNSDDAVDLDGSTEAIIEENIIRYNGDDGIEIRLHEYTGPTLNIIIRNNTISTNDKDGIQLIAIARVTVRANINRLVGGAGEETILARVGEGIVSTIGSADSHKAVLENPDAISKTVLAKGLDSGTAFEILSIDIADVDVGKNIGAELQIDQAEADKQIAQAKAEERRALAVAHEQENRARVEEMRAEVVKAEAEVPMAMAEAFRAGSLGVMDYMKYRNVESDTRMRDSIAGTGEDTEI